MNKHKILAILLLTVLAAWGRPCQAQRSISQNRQLYDSIFNAYHRRSRFGSNDSLTADINKMLRMARRDRNKHAEMLALMDLAIGEGQRGNVDSMFAYMERVHKMDDRNTPYTIKAYEYYSDGIVYYISHQYARSIDALEKAKQAFINQNDSVMRAKTLVNISSIYSDQMMYYKAENVLNEAIEITNDDTRAMTLLHLAGLKMKMGDANEGRKLLNESCRLMNAAGNSYTKIDPFTSNYWRYYHHLRYYNYRLRNNQDSAKYHVDELKKVVETFGHPEDMVTVDLLYAELYRSGGDYAKAVELCQNILSDSILTKAETLLSTYKTMAPCLASLGRYKEAYETEIKINQLMESSAFTGSHDLASAEMFSHYEMRIRKMENEQHDRLIRSTTIASTSIVAAMVCLFILLVFKISKRNEDKNKSAPTTPSTSGDDQNSAWITFEQKFRQKHEDYEERLKRKFTELTGTELKICMLIHEGMDDEQCAQTLNLSQNSMKVYRSRIRKKLNLAPSGTTIDDFLKRF